MFAVYTETTDAYSKAPRTPMIIVCVIIFLIR